MNQPVAKPDDAAIREALLVVVANLDKRIAKLEEPEKKSLLKRFTDNAGAVALFLGLVLTGFSLYDVLVTKPNADRISAISQFNAAVSSAALIRQELAAMQVQVKDPALQVQIMSAAMPRIQNSISTARAILPDLKDADVGIPQLIVLIYEAGNLGDPSAEEFVKRAVRKAEPSPYLRAEAKRYEGKYLFATGRPAEGRAAMAQSLELLPKNAFSGAARAYNLADWITLEFMSGDCAVVETNLLEFAKTARGISVDQKRQLASNLDLQLRQYQGLHCPIPQNLGVVTTL